VKRRAVHPRHPQVAHDEIEGALGHTVERVGAVARRHRVEAGVAQRIGHGRRQRGLVFHDEYRRAAPQVLRRCGLRCG